MDRFNSFYTKKNSLISRYQNNVGKRMGSRIYVHRNYATEIIPDDLWKLANEILNKNYPSFVFSTLTYNLVDQSVRFNESSDFDTAREPHVGKYVTVLKNGAFSQIQNSNSIWHHKWLWVKDDYVGFDVDKSKQWSKLWSSVINESAKSTDRSWMLQLKECGLGSTMDN